MQYSEYQRIVAEHARPDRLAWDLYRRNPRFDSAQQFGAFIALVADHWTGAPGLASSTMLAIERYRIGCVVQTTPDYSSCQDVLSVYHVGWITRILREVRRRLVDEQVQRERGKLKAEHAPTCACAACSSARKRGELAGELAFAIWTNVDVFQTKQGSVAKMAKVSDATVSRRVRDVRAAVEDELAREHKLSV